MLSKAEVVARLERAGAFWAADMDDQHELWVTQWGFEFWVPMAGPHGSLPEDVLEDIEDDIRRSKPP